VEVVWCVLCRMRVTTARTPQRCPALRSYPTRCATGRRWCLRSEVLALGLHRIPMGGIDTGNLPVPVGK
jgi:hypothetical protein